MTYDVIDNLVDNTINKIFEGKDLSQLNDYDKALLIYQYLINTISYDYLLLERRHKRSGPDNLLQEVLDVFEKHTGICSSMSQVYKLLLEKVNIQSVTVICNDGNPVSHQLLAIKNKDDNSWYFSDVTRGIIYKDEGLDNFCYGLDRCSYVNQKMLGTFPDSLYDAVFDRKIDRGEGRLQFNEFSLCYLPEKIIVGRQVK
jgi:hypothetical protein